MLVTVAAAACGSSRAELPHEAPPPTPRVVQAVDPEVGILVARAPERLSVDGDLGEWGAKAAAPVIVALGGRVVAQDSFTDVETSRVALWSGGISMAATLDARTSSGVWFGIASYPSELPPVGNYVVVYPSDPDPVWDVVPVGCEAVHELVPPTGNPETAECIATQRQREEVERTHARRFQRWYLVEPAGVSVLDELGRVSPVSGARVAFRDSPNGRTAEASIPLSALPRFYDAKITRLQVAARVATAVAPKLNDQLARAPWQQLPQPVAFEPFAELRAEATKRSVWMSYQPGDANEVEVARYPSLKERRSFEFKQEPLYRKVATIGAAEFGYLALARPLDPNNESDRVAQVVMAGGKTTVLGVNGVPMFTTERDGSLHVFSFVRVHQWLASA